MPAAKTSYQVHTINSYLPPGYQQPCRHRHRTPITAQPCLEKAKRTLTRDDQITFAVVAKEKGRIRRLNPAEIKEYQTSLCNPSQN